MPETQRRLLTQLPLSDGTVHVPIRSIPRCNGPITRSLLRRNDVMIRSMSRRDRAIRVSVRSLSRRGDALRISDTYCRYVAVRRYDMCVDTHV